MQSRREFLAAAGAATAQAQSAKPNVVIIYCDDLGYGDVGCYGSPLRTPNIDRLAAEGMRFTNFYSGNPVCSPSRTSLLTGRYCVRAGVPRVFFPYDKEGLPIGEITIANALRETGYATQCVGKWHLGHLSPYLPTERGFDHYFGIPYSNDMNPRWLMEDKKVLEENVALEDLTPRYTERAVKFIEGSKDKPFFLYMPHTYPHIPLGASKRFRGKSPYGIYGDVIEELDWSVGEVLAALKRTGVENNTLVVFSSDNGPWFQGSPGRLRGRKGMTWEGGQRVPMIARMPGRIPRGKTCHGIAGVWDMMPTICSLTGAKPPGVQLDGYDIWPLLSGKAPEMTREAMLLFDTWDVHAARLGKWKLHVARRNHTMYSAAPAQGAMTLPIKSELYDLATDIDESFDVAELHPAVVQDIQTRIDRVIAGMPDPVKQARAEVLKRPVLPTATGAIPRQQLKQ